MIRLVKSMKYTLINSLYSAKRQTEKYPAVGNRIYTFEALNPVLQRSEAQPITGGLFARYLWTRQSDSFALQLDDQKFRRFCKLMPSMDEKINECGKFKRLNSMLELSAEDNTVVWFPEKYKAYPRVFKPQLLDNKKTDWHENIYQFLCGSNVESTDAMIKILPTTLRCDNLAEMSERNIISAFGNQLQCILREPSNNFTILLCKSIEKYNKKLSPLYIAFDNADGGGVNNKFVEHIRALIVPHNNESLRILLPVELSEEDLFKILKIYTNVCSRENGFINSQIIFGCFVFKPGLVLGH
ncbi:uncharacterized protein LOC119680999 [Teleopsis dalmanni]|uniref:uncharacterized protein LOC119680999 n=1 Tax=Teleopsis dalmanni TaxID=139649 RepID=UPI0018CDE6AC|nr:uncharacterized protein LOC119680999 [Teleopsis dalmanni]